MCRPVACDVRCSVSGNHGVPCGAERATKATDTPKGPYPTYVKATATNKTVPVTQVEGQDGRVTAGRLGRGGGGAVGAALQTGPGGWAKGAASAAQQRQNLGERVKWLVLAGGARLMGGVAAAPRLSGVLRLKIHWVP